MTPEIQMLFDIVIGVASVFGGYMLKVILDSIKELRARDEGISRDISMLAITLPTNYTSKPDLERISDAIFKKLDRIEEKLDGKQDKVTP